MKPHMLAPQNAWQSLLWKDFQQVKPALLIVVVSLLAFQIFVVVATVAFHPAGAAQIFSGASAMVIMGPLISMLACVGLLIGQERQTGSWAWSSSLPVSWLKAMASMGCVSVMASASTLLPLSLVPMLVYALGYHHSTDEPSFLLITLWVSLVVAIDLGVFLSIFMLVFREPLTGMVVGAIAFLLGQSMLLQFFINYAIEGPWQLTGDTWNQAFIAAAVLTFLLSAAVFVVTYRWRWTFGQSTELRFRRARPVVTLRERAHSGAVTISRRLLGAPTGEFSMLLSQSLRISLMARLCTIGVPLVGVLWLNWVASVRGYVSSGAEIFAASIAWTAGLMGFLTFEGDQSSRRFRFLTDRGVSTLKFVSARLLVTLGWVILTSIVSYACVDRVWKGAWSDSVVSWGLAIAPAFYVWGTLCALCFRRPPIGFVLAILGSALTLLLYTTVHKFSRYLFANDISPDWFVYGVAACVPLSVGLGVAALFWLARKWIVLESPKLELHLAWIFPTLLLLPLVLTTALGFLFVPKVPWQAISLSEVQADARDLMVPPLTNAALAKEQVDSGSLGIYTLDVTQQLPGWQDRTEAWIASIERILQAAPQQQPAHEQTLVGDGLHTATVQSEAYVETVRNLDRLIRSTATLGNDLGRHGLTKQSQRLWSCNKRLQELSVDGATLRDTFEARTLSSEQFRNMLEALMAAPLPKNSLTDWGDPDQILKSYLPDDARLASKMRYLVHENATSLYYRLNNHSWSLDSLANSVYPAPIRLLPVLRWRQARVLAVELDYALKYVSDVADNPVNPPSELAGALRQLCMLWWEYQTQRFQVEALLDSIPQQ